MMNKANGEPGSYTAIHSLTEYCLLLAWYSDCGDTKMIQKLCLPKESQDIEGEKQVNTNLQQNMTSVIMKVFTKCSESKRRW